MLFDKRQTNISKGIGLMMLLWCHLFINTNDFRIMHKTTY